MNHAFLIICNSEPIVLSRLVKILSKPNHHFFIHIDKKYNELSKFDQLRNTPNVTILNKRVKVNWGGRSQIKATLELIKEARKRNVPQYDYYHLISGADFPCVNNDTFDHFFEINNGMSYLSYDKKQNKDLCCYRMNHYHLLDQFDIRNNKRLWIKDILENLLEHLFKRRESYNWQKGANWFSLHLTVINYIMNYISSNPNYYRRFAYTECCDEIFFHTLLYDHIHKLNIITSTNLRYIDWSPTKEVNSLPAILDSNDYNNIINSGALFCRKIDPVLSDSLMSKLEES